MCVSVSRAANKLICWARPGCAYRYYVRLMFYEIGNGAKRHVASAADSADRMYPSFVRHI